MVEGLGFVRGNLDSFVQIALVRGTAARINCLSSEKVVAAAADGGVDLAEICGYHGTWEICRLLHVERGDTVAIRVVPAAKHVGELLLRGPRGRTYVMNGINPVLDAHRATASCA